MASVETMFTTSFLNNNFDNSSLEEDLVCRIFQGDEAKCKTVLVVKRISASLSVIGCMFVLGVILLFRQYREVSQRMIANLSVAALFTGIACLLEDFAYTTSTLCKVQGALLTFLVWECFLWTSCIMFSLYLRLVYNVDIRRAEKILTLVFWLIPLIPTSLGAIYDMYAPAGAWCWMKNEWQWRLGTVYAWKILSVVVYTVITVHILITMKKLSQERHADPATLAAIKADIKTLRAYPLIYFLMNVFSVIVRIENAVNTTHDQEGYTFILLLLQNVADPLYGGALAVAYVLNKSTRNKLNLTDIRGALQRCFHNAGQINEFSIEASI